MKTISISTSLITFAAIIGFAGGSASAADLGGGRTVVSQPPDFSRPSAQSDDLWAGFYAGVGVGYTIGENGFNDNGTSFSDHVLGSVFAGYNWRLGRLVYGLEGEVGLGSLGTATMPGFGAVSTDVDWQGTLRARVGLLVTPSLLVFATAGGSYAGLSFTDSVSASTDSQNFFGYQVGLGAEWKMTDRLSLRFDYNYNDLGSGDVTLANVTNTFEPTFHTLRLGLSFKF